jgi:hypothetical protein
MRHPDGSIPCNRCHTDMVVVDGRYTCDCDVRKVALAAPDEANRLRQCITLLRDQNAICDRCNRDQAFRLVACGQGCSHAQCSPCADHTKDEAIAERAYRPHATVTEEVVEETYTTYETDSSFLGALGGGTFGGSTFGGTDVVIEDDYVEERYNDGGDGW